MRKMLAILELKVQETFPLNLSPETQVCLHAF